MRHQVIVGIDGTDASRAAVEWAADEAGARGAPLHVLHAWLGETLRAPAGQEVPHTREAGEQALRAAAEQVARDRPELVVTTELVDGYARDALVEASESADLLVLGTRGSGGFPRLLVGSTSLHASCHAHCPVVVVHPPAPGGRAGGVLVGVDGEKRNDAVLDFALAAAERLGAPLEAVYAWSYPRLAGQGFPLAYPEEELAADRERLLFEALAGPCGRHPGVEVAATAVRSGAAQLLVTLSEVHRLVVVGRHGAVRGPMRRLGSVSQAVVQHAHGAVAVVPVD